MSGLTASLCHQDHGPYFDFGNVLLSLGTLSIAASTQGPWDGRHEPRALNLSHKQRSGSKNNALAITV
eukprot:3704905-Amphidinium_carterae.1